MLLCIAAAPGYAESQTHIKQQSAFFSDDLLAKAQRNVAGNRWAASIKQQKIKAAKPWIEMTDQQLWDLMFGPTITRSWMVWSNGFCPKCRQSVPMYNWKVDALGKPWKVGCPHCSQLFPTNDFHSFYRSGLDEHGVFDPARADRSLLFNTAHPDPADPLHKFGVDDGEGYIKDQNRWRFIGAYLIYGQFKQAVLAGIQILSDAYVLTGDTAYARKAAILLDRVADLYPGFDFGAQGFVYEKKGRSGYVSTWHDACRETRQMALAYDKIFRAIKDDAELIAFLSLQARKYKLENPKTSIHLIRKNIEQGILVDALNNPEKTFSNYPLREITASTIKIILGWPGNRAEVLAELDPVIKKATAVDGLTGEKGLASYSAAVVNVLADFIGYLDRLDPDFLEKLIERCPTLRLTYRFHIDTLCCGRYYPLVGDTRAFAKPVEKFPSVGFTANPRTGPSGYSFMWRLYRITGDTRYVQILYKNNRNSVEGLPYDLFVDDPQDFQNSVAEIIKQEGADLKLGSIDKQKWHLAILRSGSGANERALWIHYEIGGNHRHNDTMNIGLFAKGLDLMPDFGYPPVQYGGGSGSPRASWYKMAAAHNTVVVDANQVLAPAAGKTTLWADGKRFQAITVSMPENDTVKRFERTLCLIDVSDTDSYIVDLFRVAGGSVHEKFMHSHFATLTTHGLGLSPVKEYSHQTQMRNFLKDPSPPPAWSADWKIIDHYKLVKPDADIHLKYTDLTADAQAYTAEKWVVEGIDSTNKEAWIPSVIVRRQSPAQPLTSTFTGIIEPYENASNIASVRRVDLTNPAAVPHKDSCVAVEVILLNDDRDLIVAHDSGCKSKSNTLTQHNTEVNSDGSLYWIRRNSKGAVLRMALCQGRVLVVGEIRIELSEITGYTEWIINRNIPQTISATKEH